MNFFDVLAQLVTVPLKRRWNNLRVDDCTTCLWLRLWLRLQVVPVALAGRRIPLPVQANDPLGERYCFFRSSSSKVNTDRGVADAQRKSDGPVRHARFAKVDDRRTALVPAFERHSNAMKLGITVCLPAFVPKCLVCRTVKCFRNEWNEVVNALSNLGSKSPRLLFG